jgi:hypothetical protein
MYFIGSKKDFFESQSRQDIIKNIINNWDISKEIESWSIEAARKKIGYETYFKWNNPRERNVIHPSSLGNPCDMFLYLQSVGGHAIPKELWKKRMIFDTGTAIHLQMQYYQKSRAEHYGYTYQEEVRFSGSKLSEELNLYGSADGYMCRSFDNKGEEYKIRMIWEYKTTNKAKFEKLGSKIGYNYLAQIHAYMAIADIPIAILLYICKDNSLTKAIPIYFDHDFWSNIHARLLDIRRHASQIIDPVRHISDSCKYCDFYEDCSPKNSLSQEEVSHEI